MTSEQAVSLAFAISHAELALRVFAAHEPPPSLVYARYFTEQAQLHLTELLQSLPERDRTAVARILERSRRAVAGEPLPLDVVPLIPRQTPQTSRTTEEPPHGRR